MANETPSSDTPQFGKAEYASQQKAGACALCGRELGAAYYRVKNLIACESCAFEAKSAAPGETHQAFARAVIFGIGGAILGLIVYSAFTIITRIEIGIMAVAVGYLVGRAMKMGSRGSGGRRYQIVAVGLTYLAVSLSESVIVAWSYGGVDNLPIVSLLLYGLGSPIHELRANPLNGAIGLVILFTGIRFAWRMTAGTEATVAGPYANRTNITAPAPPPAL